MELGAQLVDSSGCFGRGWEGVRERDERYERTGTVTREARVSTVGAGPAATVYYT